MSHDIVIVAAARTPVGSFNGAFANTPAHELGAIVIKEALKRANVDAKDVDEVIMGQILAAGQGQNPARQAAMKAGVPQEATAWGLNQLCGSGLRAVALGMQQIANGDARVIVAGGQESMSQAQHVAHMRNGTKMGDVKFLDSMLKDGLLDAFAGYHMGKTAENVAAKWQITRESRTSSPSPRRTRPRPPRRPASSRTRSPPSPSRPARATSSSIRTNTSVTARRSTR
jgi:acetyl-CoA C-acetyltransferase